MSQNATLEQRLSVVEKELTDLKQRVEQMNSQKTWLDRVAGSMKDQPEFGEVVKLGAAIRQADRPADEA